MNISGQEHILNYLKKSIEKNKVSHAYLFIGPIHSEKEKVASWLGECLGCQEPDITKITVPEDKKEIGIEQIRGLRRYLSLSPHSSSYKIAIIDSAEKMTPEAVNALLKTLEEPRGNTVLILITNTPSALPETIISRCETIKFKAIPLNKIPKDFFKKEHINILEKPLNDIFKYLEKITREKSQIIPLLDSWLFWFRDLLLNKEQKKYPEEKLVKILKEIQKTKNLISNTNVNSRLALEVLAIELKVQSQKSKVTV